MGPDETALPVRKMRKVCGAPMRWACNEKENAVINSLKKVYRRRSTKWWYAPHTQERRKKIPRTAPDGSISGDGTIEECVGQDGYSSGWRERLDDSTKRENLDE